MKKKCELCENLIDYENLYLCDSCIEKGKTFQNAEEIGSIYEEKVLINDFYAHCFSKDEINEMLYLQFKSKPEDEQKKLINSYIEKDMTFFVGWLVRKCRKQFI